MRESPQTRADKKQFSRKQWLIALCTIALAFTLGGALVILPQNFAARAANAPRILVSPKSVSYSHNISIFVKGYFFGANENVNVYFNYTGPGTGILEATIQSGLNGQFSAQFPIPLVPTATYTIAAIGQTSGDKATGTTQILPHMYLSPRAGGVGSRVYIFGNAFGAQATAFALTGGSLNLTTILIGQQITGDVLHNPNLGYALALGMIVVMALSIGVYALLQRTTARWLQ